MDEHINLALLFHYVYVLFYVKNGYNAKTVTAAASATTNNNDINKNKRTIRDRRVKQIMLMMM